MRDVLSLSWNKLPHAGLDAVHQRCPMTDDPEISGLLTVEVLLVPRFLPPALWARWCRDHEMEPEGNDNAVLPNGGGLLGSQTEVVVLYDHRVIATLTVTEHPSVTLPLSATWRDLDVKAIPPPVVQNYLIDHGWRNLGRWGANGLSYLKVSEGRDWHVATPARRDHDDYVTAINEAITTIALQQNRPPLAVFYELWTDANNLAADATLRRMPVIAQVWEGGRCDDDHR